MTIITLIRITIRVIKVNNSSLRGCNFYRLNETLERLTTTLIKVQFELFGSNYLIISSFQSDLCCFKLQFTLMISSILMKGQRYFIGN